MQLILRNFITILKRFKTASILNVLGLSTAFAAFLIILMQVRYEQSFDKFHSKAERDVPYMPVSCRARKSKSSPPLRRTSQPER